MAFFASKSGVFERPDHPFSGSLDSMWVEGTGLASGAQLPVRSALEWVLEGQSQLIQVSGVSSVGFKAAIDAMAPATKAAIVSDMRCYIGYCAACRPQKVAIPADPETLVKYLHWRAKGTEKHGPAKGATLARRIASIARVHRMLGLGEREPLPTQAGMVRDTLKAIARERQGRGQSGRQKQAAALRLGAAMSEGGAAPGGVTLTGLLAACGTDLAGLRDAALFSMAYDAGLRVSELVGSSVEDLTLESDGTGRLFIPFSKTDQGGEGRFAWVSKETMGRVSAWLLTSEIEMGSIFRRIHVLRSKPYEGGQQLQRIFVGQNALTRKGVIGILRSRVLAGVDLGVIEVEAGTEGDVARALSSHSFRVGLTQDLFAAGEDGAGIALALRWSSPNTALRYARELAVGSNAAARVLGRLRQGS